jgi:hypothetical protein
MTISVVYYHYNPWISYRIEPPPSAPIAIGKMPVATAPPLPPLDPPQEHLRLYAFLGVPVFGLTVKVLVGLVNIRIVIA